MGQHVGRESGAAVADFEADFVDAPSQANLQGVVGGVGGIVQQVEQRLLQARVGDQARGRAVAVQDQPAVGLRTSRMPMLAQAFQPAVGREPFGVFQAFGAGASRQAGDDLLADADLLAEQGDVCLLYTSDAADEL